MGNPETRPQLMVTTNVRDLEKEETERPLGVSKEYALGKLVLGYGRHNSARR